MRDPFEIDQHEHPVDEASGVGEPGADFQCEEREKAELDAHDLGDEFDDFATSADTPAEHLDAATDDSTGNADAQAWSAFEDELAIALGADSSAEFLGAMIGGLARAARFIAPDATSNCDRQDNGQVFPGGDRLAATAAQLACWFSSDAHSPHTDNPASFAARRRMSSTHRAKYRESSSSPLLATIGQLIAKDADDGEAFDVLHRLCADEAADEALPVMVGAAARLAAQRLRRNAVDLTSLATRRALLQSVANAARTLLEPYDAAALSALPRIVQASLRHARQSGVSARQLPGAVAHEVPRIAQRAARDPQFLRRLTHSPEAPAPLSRPTRVGRGLPTTGGGTARRYRFNGPVELTIRAR